MSDDRWLAYLRTNSEAFSSFFEYLAARDTALTILLKDAVAKGDLNKAQTLNGALVELDTLRKAATIDASETRAYQEYQELAKGIRSQNHVG